MDHQKRVYDDIFQMLPSEENPSPMVRINRMNPVPDFELLATVPGDRIYCVQIDDAAAEPRASLRDDTNNRLLPGDGDLDLTRAVRALAQIDALRWVGPEVISPTLEAMPAVEVAQLAGDKVRELIATALE